MMVFALVRACFALAMGRVRKRSLSISFEVTSWVNDHNSRDFLCALRSLMGFGAALHLQNIVPNFGNLRFDNRLRLLRVAEIAAL